MNRPWYEDANNADAFCIALEAIRNGAEGNSITIQHDNPEADSAATQSCVDVVADFTDWKERRFYGRTPLEAILAAGREQALRR